MESDGTVVPQLESRAVRKRCDQILAWWSRHGRKDLPWQNSGDPYKALVAEVMLQQTGVQTVLPYYVRFLRHFPDVRSLARGRSDRLMKQWQGLGYYARARHLREACTRVAAAGVRWPENANDWQALPGVGRSTANALMASLSDVPHPVLDGNVKRVLARLFAVREPTNDPKTLRSLWGYAEQFLPRYRGRDFAQAMMDLGATVCTRRTPKCASCPVRTTCQSYANDWVDQIPRRNKYPPKQDRRYCLLWFRRPSGRYLLGPRPAPGVWGGLWAPPMLEFTDEAVGDLKKPDMARLIRRSGGLSVRLVRVLARKKHELTHRRLWLHSVEVVQSEQEAKSDPPVWARRESEVKYGWHHLRRIPGGVPTPLLEVIAQLQAK